MNPLEQANQRLENAGITHPLKAKWQSLITELSSYPSAVIAYSGGVDSSFLAYAAAQAMGGPMIAVTVFSPLEPAGLQQDVFRFVEQYGIKHDFLTHDPLQNAKFQNNPPERCYLCKLGILNILWEYARDNHYAVLLEGQNADDQHEYRPGRQAVKETGTFSPLAQNALTKAEIRWLARALGLPIWNQPSSPCLATRIPYGMTITEERLDQIASAENYLHQRGFPVVRVRHLQNYASIEVEPGHLAKLLEMREDVVSYFKEIGFHHVSLDLQGYRSGSMDEGLSL